MINSEENSVITASGTNWDLRLLLSEMVGHVGSAPRVDRRPLPVHAYTGHAGSVIALLCDSVTTWSGGETAGIVRRHKRLQAERHASYP
jgi:hypothetical protein